MAPQPTDARIVTLLTDFGTSGPYVAAMKGVLLTRAPDLRAVVDVTHEVPPQDVRAAALLLQASWPWFPPGTIHLVVVDPEVGTDRRILVASCGGQILVGPDNGVLAPALDGQRPQVFAADPERAPRAGSSRTFHGRDRFAPLVAQLAQGTLPAELGARVTEWRALELPEAQPLAGGGLRAEVLAVDPFGNLITSVHKDQLGSARWSCEVAGRRAPLVGTYAEVAPGELLCLVDSHERVEVAVREGDAANELGIGCGAEVRLVPATDSEERR